MHSRQSTYPTSQFTDTFGFKGIMQCSLHRTACRAVNSRGAHHKAVLRACRVPICRALKQQQQPAVTDASTSWDMVSLSLATMLLQPLSAHADAADAVSSTAADATQAVNKAAASAANTVEAPNWLGYAVILSPIILYAIFNVYRSQVNPRAKFTDFLFICAGVAVIANLVSIIAFKVRLF